jgi:SAM-dependent methyltransferase
VSGVHDRPDIARAFPHLRRAGHCGFEVECEYTTDTPVATARFDLTALRDWVPIGEMTAYHAEGMYEAGPWPPERLARRLVGTGDSRALAVWALHSVHGTLEVLGRYRKLQSFGSALLVGSDTGMLEPFLRRLLTAKLTEVEFDAELLEWRSSIERPASLVRVAAHPPTELPDESFDLALAHSALTRMTRDQQIAWLSEIARLLRSGGYAVLAVNGEVVLPFIGDRQISNDLEAVGVSDRALQNGGAPGAHPATYQTRSYTTQICSESFDVIKYLEGGVANRQDLIVVRRP